MGHRGDIALAQPREKAVTEDSNKSKPPKAPLPPATKQKEQQESELTGRVSADAERSL